MKSLQFRMAGGRLKRVVGVGAVLGMGLIPVAQAQAQSRLTGAGATFPYPLYSKWFSVYRGSQINYQAIGSGGGINALKNGTVDFGASDAPLSNADMKTMPGQVVHIPTVAGAVAVVYNGLPRGLRLSGPVLANIYLGQITRWNDAQIAALNPGMRLPNRAVTVARRSDSSGTSHIFTSYLKAVSPQWARQVGAGKAVSWPVGLGGKGNDGVAAIVKQTPGAVGYVELAYATQNGLPFAAIRNRAGAFVNPSVAGVTSAASASARQLQRDVRYTIVNAPGAASYPISGFTYILVYKNQSDKAKAKSTVNFLHWAMGAGQRYARPLGYAPLPRSIVTMNMSKLRTIR
jgi:phosphate transport system substrate-binding protein